MTTVSRTISYQPSPSWFRLPLWRLALERDIADRIYFPVTMLVLLFLYLLLQNPYWVPAGDSELYTAVARSLAWRASASACPGFVSWRSCAAGSAAASAGGTSTRAGP